MEAAGEDFVQALPAYGSCIWLRTGANGSKVVFHVLLCAVRQQVGMDAVVGAEGCERIVFWWTIRWLSACASVRRSNGLYGTLCASYECTLGGMVMPEQINLGRDRGLV